MGDSKICPQWFQAVIFAIEPGEYLKIVRSASHRRSPTQNCAAGVVGPIPCASFSRDEAHHRTPPCPMWREQGGSGACVGRAARSPFSRHREYSSFRQRNPIRRIFQILYGTGSQPQPVLECFNRRLGRRVFNLDQVTWVSDPKCHSTEPTRWICSRWKMPGTNRRCWWHASTISARAQGARRYRMRR